MLAGHNFTKRTALLVLIAAGGFALAQEPAQTKIKIACVGDSITAGAGVMAETIANYMQEHYYRHQFT